MRHANASNLKDTVMRESTSMETVKCYEIHHYHISSIVQQSRDGRKAF